MSENSNAESMAPTESVVENATQQVNESVDLAPEAHESAQALSFDELDALTDGRSDTEILNEASKNKEASKEDESIPEGSSEPEEEQATEEAVEEEIKKLIAKYGEEDLEIAANAVFKHKVDGEEVDVELQELLNNYSGKVSYDKKFQEFSSQKKEFDDYKVQYDNDIEAISNYVNTFREKMSSENPMEALDYFAEFSGMKPHEFKRQLINAMIPEVNRVSQMSADEYKNEYLRAENSYLQRQKESENARLREEQSQSELQNEIKQVQEAHNMTEEAFLESFQELSESEYEGEITPQAVAEYHMHSQAFSKADDILSQVNQSLVDDDQVVESLQKVIVENPSFDDNDLLEIVQEVYGNFKQESSEKVSKKVAKPTKKPSTPKKQLEDVIDWDDL